MLTSPFLISFLYSHWLIFPFFCSSCFPFSLLSLLLAPLSAPPPSTHPLFPLHLALQASDAEGDSRPQLRPSPSPSLSLSLSLSPSLSLSLPLSPDTPPSLLPSPVRPEGVSRQRLLPSVLLTTRPCRSTDTDLMWQLSHYLKSEPVCVFACVCVCVCLCVCVYLCLIWPPGCVSVCLCPSFPTGQWEKRKQANEASIWLGAREPDRR